MFWKWTIRKNQWKKICDCNMQIDHFLNISSCYFLIINVWFIWLKRQYSQKIIKNFIFYIKIHLTSYSLFSSFSFLDASSHLYNRLCLSIGWSVGLLVSNQLVKGICKITNINLNCNGTSTFSSVASRDK